MITDCVKLRSDIVISEQKSGEATIYVLKDPSSGRFFRFKEIEGFILRQLDGETPLQTIREGAEKRYEMTLAPNTLEHFTARVKNLGLLETIGATEAPARKRRRWSGDLFYLRFKIFDPNALFLRLAGKLGFFFTRLFLVLSAAAVSLALGITFASTAQIQTQVYGLFQSFSLVAAWFIVLLVITAHEFAHGVTCRRFGGQVHEVGFLLLYFMPGFYCNVSDAWLFPEKSKRLWVTFAGAYFEVFIWAVSTIFWRLTEPFTVLNEAALVVMATSGIKTLFNLNPLIKLDGYYLLSDYLEIPNLRKKAFDYLKNRARPLFGFTPLPFEEPTLRERKIYLTYGILAAVYSFWLVATFVFYFGEFLTSKYQGWGFLFFLVFLFGMFRAKLRTFASRPLAWFHTIGKGSPKLPKRTKTIVGFVVVAAGLFLIRMPLTVTGEFVILPIHNADVRAEIEETIAEVFVQEGDAVQAGDPIVRLSGRALEAERQKTKAAMEEVGAKLKLLQAGPRPEEVKLAKTRVAKAEEVLRFAEKDQERSRALFERGLIPRREWEQAQQQAAVREKELDEAKSSLNMVRAGSRKEELEAAEAEFEGLESELQYLDSQKRLLTVRSPASGIVATPKLKEKIGQHLAKGELIAKVYELKTLTVEIPISEKDIADVIIGQPVVVKTRAYPQQSFKGNVISIAPIATQEDERRPDGTVVVRANLENSQLLLKPGMSGMAKIYGSKRTLFNLLVRRFIRFIRVEVWSWW